jgi:murein DD-endopeptidase MepM/ murein hydrolase activator NlpD
MRHTKYRYNPITCRYEAIKPGVATILVPVVLFLGVSTSLFVLILLFHSTWVTTDKEVALSLENKALSEHHKRLTGELKTVKTSLAFLTREENILQQNLVAGKTPEGVLESLPVVKSKDTKHDFKELLPETANRTQLLLQNVMAANVHFGDALTMSTDDLKLLVNIPSLQPIDNPEVKRLASGFGERVNPFHKANYFHRGIDFIAPRGTPVFASANGKVAEVKKSQLPMGEGNSIELDHGNGFKTRYTHLGDIQVKQGQFVSKGSVIATIGMSGGSVSPHLHFEVLKNNKHVDPARFILEGISPSDRVALLLLANYKNQSFD